MWFLYNSQIFFSLFSSHEHFWYCILLVYKNMLYFVYVNTIVIYLLFLKFCMCFWIEVVYVIFIILGLIFCLLLGVQAPSL